MPGLLATAITVMLITWLCIGDPKRRRAQRIAGTGQTATTRRVIAAAACLPGVVCALLGDAAAFLVWLGASGAAGWLVALLFARAPLRG